MQEQKWKTGRLRPSSRICLFEMIIKNPKSLIGKKVKYLRKCDIDNTGRGYSFPKVGLVEGIIKNNIIIDGDYIHFSDVAILKEVGKQHLGGQNEEKNIQTKT